VNHALYLSSSERGLDEVNIFFVFIEVRIAGDVKKNGVLPPGYKVQDIQENNDDDVITLIEDMLSEKFGTDITVNAITKKTFTGTENTKKNTIKGSFKIYMTASGYDESCGCERTGKLTVSGSFTGTPPVL